MSASLTINATADNGIMECPDNSYLDEKSSKCNAKFMAMQIIPRIALSFSVMFCLTLSLVWSDSLF